MYKDEVTLNKMLTNAFINNSQAVKKILAQAVYDIDDLKTAYKQHDWLERFTIIADRLIALKVICFPGMGILPVHKELYFINTTGITPSALLPK